MKTMLMTMTALAALTIAAPASAQPWSGQRSHTDALQMQLDEGILSGAISRREAMPLQISLRQLLALEQRFSRNGFNGRENATLHQRGNLLRRDIRMAERNGFSRDRRAGWDDRDSDRRGSWDDDRRDGYAADARFDQPNRGDRFNGDVRVGHHATLRMVALPNRYRDDFRDSESVYYRFDDGRIYRINRRTDMILGLLDV